MQTLESEIAQTQTELSTGIKLQNAADDPAGMAQVNQLNAQISASQQYQANGSALNSNLTIEEQSLTDATNVMQSARDLALQANNPALTPSQRQDISTQLQQLLQQLVGTANSTDANGNYLFAGDATTTQPFAQSGNSVAYNGSTSVNQVQISPNQRISSGDSGANVFMKSACRQRHVHHRRRRRQHRHGHHRPWQCGHRLAVGARHLHHHLLRSDRLHRHRQLRQYREQRNLHAARARSPSTASAPR